MNKKYMRLYNQVCTVVPLRYRDKVCTVCKSSYRPTNSIQKRCVPCQPAFTKQQEAIAKAKQRKIRPECRLVEAAKAVAKVKGLPFNITSDYVKSIWKDTCPILGIPLFRDSNVRTDNSPSLDRIIPVKGYTIGNVHIISWRANRIKNDATHEELAKIAKYLSKLERSKT